MDGRQADLEAVYGPGGIWAEFLKRAPGYFATEIACESQAERRYRLRDVWTWHRYHERFREKHAAEIERFDSLMAAEGFVDRIEFVGSYYEGSAGDGDDLVLG